MRASGWLRIPITTYDLCKVEGLAMVFLAASRPAMAGCRPGVRGEDGADTLHGLHLVHQGAPRYPQDSPIRSLILWTDLLIYGTPEDLAAFEKGPDGQRVAAFYERLGSGSKKS